MPGVLGFGTGMIAAVSPGRREIIVTNNGDATPASGANTATHTYNSQASTGPTSVWLITWRHNTDARTLSSVSWGDNSPDSLEQASIFEEGDFGAAIAIFSGAQSGAPVLSFSGAVNASRITNLSLAGVRSTTPIDADAASHAEDAGISLAALASPGEGGVRIAAFCAEEDSDAIEWSPAPTAEVADLDAGNYRHAGAYFAGDSAATITATGDGGSPKVMVGVSLR